MYDKQIFRSEKRVFMNRKVLFGIFLFLLACALTSCEDLMQCKKCKMVSTNLRTGDVTEDLTETEYCGATLITVEATPPITDGDVKTEYVCR